MDPELALLIQHANIALVGFLRAELKLGIRYVDLAKLEAGFDAAGMNRAKELARSAVETIHRFSAKVSDPAIRSELEEGAAKLASALQG